MAEPPSTPELPFTVLDKKERAALKNKKSYSSLSSAFRPRRPSTPDLTGSLEPLPVTQPPPSLVSPRSGASSPDTIIWTGDKAEVPPSPVVEPFPTFDPKAFAKVSHDEAERIAKDFVVRSVSASFEQQKSEDKEKLVNVLASGRLPVEEEAVEETSSSGSFVTIRDPVPKIRSGMKIPSLFHILGFVDRTFPGCPVKMSSPKYALGPRGFKKNGSLYFGPPIDSEYSTVSIEPFQGRTIFWLEISTGVCTYNIHRTQQYFMVARLNITEQVQAMALTQMAVTSPGLGRVLSVKKAEDAKGSLEKTLKENTTEKENDKQEKQGLSFDDQVRFAMKLGPKHKQPGGSGPNEHGKEGNAEKELKQSQAAKDEEQRNSLEHRYSPQPKAEQNPKAEMELLKKTKTQSLNSDEKAGQGSKQGPKQEEPQKKTQAHRKAVLSFEEQLRLQLKHKSVPLPPKSSNSSTASDTSTIRSPSPTPSVLADNISEPSTDWIALASTNTHPTPRPPRPRGPDSNLNASLPPTPEMASSSFSSFAHPPTITHSLLRSGSHRRRATSPHPTRIPNSDLTFRLWRTQLDILHRTFLVLRPAADVPEAFHQRSHISNPDIENLAANNDAIPTDGFSLGGYKLAFVSPNLANRGGDTRAGFSPAWNSRHVLRQLDRELRGDLNFRVNLHWGRKGVMKWVYCVKVGEIGRGGHVTKKVLDEVAEKEKRAKASKSFGDPDAENEGESVAGGEEDRLKEAMIRKLSSSFGGSFQGSPDLGRSESPLPSPNPSPNPSFVASSPSIAASSPSFGTRTPNITSFPWSTNLSGGSTPGRFSPGGSLSKSPKMEDWKDTLPDLKIDESKASKKLKKRSRGPSSLRKTSGLGIMGLDDDPIAESEYEASFTPFPNTRSRAPSITSQKSLKEERLSTGTEGSRKEKLADAGVKRGGTLRRSSTTIRKSAETLRKKEDETLRRSKETLRSSSETLRKVAVGDEDGEKGPRSPKKSPRKASARAASSGLRGVEEAAQEQKEKERGAKREKMTWWVLFLTDEETPDVWA
ncbi:hypothetical protein K402DRAFT_461978 [Aulographum hederae CBS 113979]|uniref:Uncharacterized protein n=1 Tax=Aulographum hederae CBS 113979 TaxID=1176131 RepID=A0A6G1H5U2_9PEZI|nr:hypothetical protein K402DRAFT_461978 [Aulographum hederae CBS 113979]